MTLPQSSLPNNFYRVSIKALILDDLSRILLAKQASGLWSIPGGALDFGETPHDCLRREIREEMGLETISIAEHPIYFYTSQNKQYGVHVAHVIYETKLKSLEITPSDECLEVRFFTPQEIHKSEHMFGGPKKLALLYQVSQNRT